MNQATKFKLMGETLIQPEHFVYEVVAFESGTVRPDESVMAADLAAGISDLIEQWKDANLDNFDEDDIDAIDDIVVEALVKVMG